MPFHSEIHNGTCQISRGGDVTVERCRLNRWSQLLEDVPLLSEGREPPCPYHECNFVVIVFFVELFALLLTLRVIGDTLLV